MMVSVVLCIFSLNFREFQCLHSYISVYNNEHHHINSPNYVFKYSNISEASQSISSLDGKRQNLWNGAMKMSLSWIFKKKDTSQWLNWHIHTAFFSHLSYWKQWEHDRSSATPVSRLDLGLADKFVWHSFNSSTRWSCSNFMPSGFFTLRTHIDGFMGCAGYGLFGSLQHDMMCLCTCGNLYIRCVLYL